MTQRERIEDLGKLSVMLKELVNLEIFDNLSKHDESWDIHHDNSFCCSEKEASRVSNKLDESRRMFSMIHDKLYECLNIADGDDYHE